MTEDSPEKADPPARWEDIAARQHGLITRPQAKECGFCDTGILRCVERGTWIRVYPRVFRSASAPQTPHQALLAAVLWTKGKGVASQQAALWLHGFNHVEPAVEVSAVPSLNPPPGLTCHHIQRLHPDEIEEVDGIRTTTVERTLFDRAGVESPQQLRRIFDEALRRNMTTLRELEVCVERNGTRGHAGIEVLVELMKDRGAFGTTDSDLETDVVTFLKERGFPQHRRGFDVVVDGKHIARPDFSWPNLSVALLCQSTFHLNTRRYQRDLEQENDLERLGWRKVRLTRRMLENDPDSIAASLWKALEDAKKAA